MNGFWQLVILILVIYAVIYTIINRICSCIEQINLTKRGFFDDIPYQENPAGENPKNREEI